MRYLIPMAADNDLFPRSEFHFPKPLVEIKGRPLIEHVVDSIREYDHEAEFIFILRKVDCDQFSLDASLRLLTQGRCIVVKLSKPTMGSACSALMAIDHINDDLPIVILNSDQVFEVDISLANRRFIEEDHDAAVITFASIHPRWSFVRLDDSGTVAEAAEKRVLSRRAIAGYYFFKHGKVFVEAVQSSIKNGSDVDGQYFIAPALNEVILRGGKVGYHDIDEHAHQSLYSPQRLKVYERRLEAREDIIMAKPLQIIIPMAGLGSRFSNAGYAKPKPFIDVLGMTMIERVMDNLKVPNARFILLARAEHMLAEPDLVNVLEARGDVTFLPVDRVTEGAACTVLLARGLINRDAPMLIANCDQIVDFNCAAFIENAQNRRLDGSVLVFRDVHRDPKWSFARTSDRGLVEEVREKVAISELATVGLYYFGTAQLFFDSALDMIALNERVNGEFYVCPVYNYLIKFKKKIGVFEIDASAMHGTGTPADLSAYVQHISK